MYMITNEQANRLFEMVKNKVVKGEERERLIAEIKANKPTNAAETVFGEMRDLNDEEAKKYREMLAKDTVIATAEQIEKAGKPQTNGDKWRAMSDEQIAEIIQRDGCCSCPCDEYLCEIAAAAATSEKEYNEICKAAIVKWLGTEAKE